MNSKRWLRENGQVVTAAAGVTVVMLGLLAYWFVVAERGRAFLYDHRGATPFDVETTSRYWMAPLVAAGYLCLAATLVAVIGLVRRKRRLPAPDSVMTLAAGPLVVGVLVVTALLGSPRLSLGLAVLVSLTAVVGAYLAYWAAYAIQRLVWSSLWLILDGMGLIPLLTLTQALELPGRGLSVSVELARSIVGAGLVIAILWRGIMAWSYRRLGRPAAPAGDVLRASLVLSYIALPTLHHLTATPPGYKYITTADNFMPRNLWLLLAAWTAAVVIVFGAQRLFRRQSSR